MKKTEQEPTIKISPSGKDLPWLDTGLALSVTDADGSHSSFPICRSLVQIGLPDSSRPNDVVLNGPGIAERQGVIQYQQGKVQYLNLNDACSAHKDGQVVSLCELQKGDELTLGDCRLQLVEEAAGPAALEGYSSPYRGRRWNLRSEASQVGRPGTRENQVQLEDRTVSRTHATIERRGQDFWLRSDNEAVPTYVNGRPLEQPQALADGDLIQFGLQVLRFRLRKPAIPAGDLRAGDLLAREATVVFADIWNYALLADIRPVDELIRQVSDFYEMVDQVVTENHGRLTTYLGDAVVAIFGAAGHQSADPARAVQTALTIQKRLDGLNREWLAAGMSSLRVGVGIHTGPMVLGDVSLQGKSEFAAVGAQADLAGRIEGLARQHKTKILIGPTTAAAVKGSFTLKSLGPLPVEGQSEPMELFAVTS
jgi:class 3 adenylate cyclase